MFRDTLLLLLVVLSAGCVTLQPAESARVADIQRFVDATQAAYQMPWRVTVTIWTGQRGGQYRGGNLYLNRKTLTYPHLEGLVAHEMGHYVLQHETVRGGPSYELKERPANIEAVKILERVKGYDRSRALRVYYDYLFDVETALRKEPTRGTLAGHLRACDEIRDVLAAYPDEHGVWTAWECAPTAEAQTNERGTR